MFVSLTLATLGITIQSMIDLKQIPMPFRDALACHQAFRRLGFKSDDIYVLYSDGFLYMILKTQGKEFNINLGTIEINEIEFPKIWAEIVETFNTGPEQEVLEIWDKSLIKNNFQLISGLIRKKGIMLPNLMN